ncbi:flagellar biosynthesis repressor FlbT [Aureimonas jatrophae]|jgi:flagellar biosynthesis repressor protein FlbT|uniref:Probable flagellum biosynthesis repressor protein FlbT n=1 Tax=Aureimonas jatrophae TaxID=1166073 RepID=A0A1H0JGL2_9HYPH|nr:flagellar biosynthesis repressor FlbT [Aureimonas jatrophae]MBB3951427.1 flagellar protein FlbT [Aureimonas jatrophae]SDO42643.1 flagellar protein FlbT [Aureimonas jatrophae]
MSTLRITLRAGERIFVNGAVMRVDRKTHLEFLNDVTFLLESHVMQASDATTPVRQLYFIVQLMLIDPAGADDARAAFDRSYPMLMATFSSADVRHGLQDAAELLERDRTFEALKRLRSLIPLEDAILGEPSREAAEPIAIAAGRMPALAGAR